MRSFYTEFNGLERSKFKANIASSNAILYACDFLLVFFQRFGNFDPIFAPRYSGCE